MNVKQRIRMTASEIAMGRYMRAPDHPPAEDEFSKAFAAEVLEENAAAGRGGDAGSGDGAGAVAPVADAGGDGAAAPADAGAGAAAGTEVEGGEAAAAGAEGAAPADGGAAPAAGAAADEKGPKGAAAGKGGAGGDGAGGDAGDVAAAADGGAAGKAGAGAAAVPAKGADADAILDRLAEAVASKVPAKAEPAAASEAPAAEKPPLFSETEQATLSKFKEDWPEEHKAINLMQRELGSGIIEYVFGQIAPAVKEIKDLADTLAGRAQISDIAAALGEYPSDAEIDQTREWVKTQPAYLQAGMNGVIDGGTADDVIDLVTRYREATGKQPAGAPAAEAESPKVDTELSGAAKQAAAALAPVGSKRSAVQSPEDASNFDASWAKWADTEV